MNLTKIDVLSLSEQELYYKTKKAYVNARDSNKVFNAL